MSASRQQGTPVGATQDLPPAGPAPGSRALARVVGFIVTALRGLIASMIAALLLIMIVQIVARYAFNASLIWAEEICRYLLIWVSFLAAFAAMERGEIAAVTILQDKLPRKAGLLLAALCDFAGLALTGFLVVYGLRYAERIGSQPIPAFEFLFADLFGPGVEAPATFWVYLALPVGMALLGLRLAADCVRHLTLMRSADPAAQ